MCRGNFLKRGAWTVCRFKGRGAWQERWKWCFWRGVDTPMHTMKLDALLHKTHIKVLWCNMCTSISLSKIAHQMWRDHPFSQRNKTTEWADGVVTGGDREGGMWAGQGGGVLTKPEKGGVDNIGGLHEIVGLGPLCQLWIANSWRPCHKELHLRYSRVPGSASVFCIIMSSVFS